MNDLEIAENQDPVLLAWQAPEFISHPRGKLWYTVVGLLTAGIVVYSLITQSVTTAIVFLLLATVYVLTRNQKPRTIDIKITQLGIWVHRTFYPYNMIRSFWVVYTPPFVQTLNLEIAKKSLPHVAIQLNGQEPVPIHEILSKKIPEAEGREESLMEIVTRLFRL
ncbi:hypothetical protein HZA43_03600 [Candidatus Peregrinibacteria bacterium]|nr:hypothetical protein [Candidatus Peregrinibacteria bacterium]